MKSLNLDLDPWPTSLLAGRASSLLAVAGLNVRLGDSVPNRIIKESALLSKQLAGLSPWAERTFWRLIIVADDFGRFMAEPVAVKARCYPLLADAIKSLQVQTWINELVTFGLVKLYVVEQNTYGFFPTWEKHQQKRAVKSKFPDPLANDINCNQLLANVPVFEIETEIEIEIEKRDRLLPQTSGKNSEAAESNGISKDWPEDGKWLQNFLRDQKLVPEVSTFITDYDWWDTLSEIINGLDRNQLEREMAKMKLWLDRNPRRRPIQKATSWKRFLSAWLEKAEEQARRKPQQ